MSAYPQDRTSPLVRSLDNRIRAGAVPITLDGDTLVCSVPATGDSLLAATLPEEEVLATLNRLLEHGARYHFGPGKFRGPHARFVGDRDPLSVANTRPTPAGCIRGLLGRLFSARTTGFRAPALSSLARPRDSLGPVGKRIFRTGDASRSYL